MIDPNKFMGDAPTREDGGASGRPSIARSHDALPASPASFPGVAASSNGVGGSTLPATAAFPASGKPIKRPAITDKMKLAVLRADGAFVCCRMCKLDTEIRAIQFDHVQALIDGGAHDVSNLRPICSDCHKTKSAFEHKRNSKHKRLATARAVHDAVKRGEHVRPASRIKNAGFRQWRKFNGEKVRK